jgi:hypothetical protein
MADWQVLDAQGGWSDPGHHRMSPGDSVVVVRHWDRCTDYFGRLPVPEVDPGVQITQLDYVRTCDDPEAWEIRNRHGGWTGIEAWTDAGAGHVATVRPKETAR